jgi:hypothetical protein
MAAGQRIGRRVLELLAGIDLERPRVDEDEVAARLRGYVRALGLLPPRVRFAPDIRALREARVYPRGKDRGQWQSFTGREWRLLVEPIRDGGRRTPRGLERQRPPREHPSPELQRLVLSDDIVLAAGLGRSHDVRGVQRLSRSLDRIARMLAAGGRAPRRVAALAPLAEAAAAGLFAYAVGSGGEGDLLALVRPRLRFDEQGRLHDWDGLPAAEWPNGHGLYFWHGVEMTESAGRNPDAVTPARVLGWANAERRRVAIERMGLERLLKAVEARVVQEDDYGRLWRAEREVDGEPFVAVELVNATEEPDGTRRTYFLRVPPRTRTARHAVAWTFGLTKRAYAPVAES